VIAKITNKQHHMFDAYISNIVLQIGDVYNSIQLIEADKDKQSILYSVLNSEYKSLHSELWAFIQNKKLDFPKKHLELLRKYCIFSPLTAFKCAKYIKERCDDLEKIIATDAYISYQYAQFPLKGRFELGESLIANDPLLSYMYSVFVICDRFELGEKAIYSDSYCSQLYERFLSK
jgi:hypothetical protein